MKKEYIKPELEIILFSLEDIMLPSDSSTGDDGGDWGWGDDF